MSAEVKKALHSCFLS
uniref:Uncharacterized protein n=1 Tax=Anguilla anguilla TaxID=7936 RepID=A0A0E9R378_ANGAN